jgi:hypothetical protein
MLNTRQGRSLECAIHVRALYSLLL